MMLPEPEPTPEPTEKAPHEYHAHSQLLSGFLVRPIKLSIDSPASVSLEGRENYFFKNAEVFHLDRLISLKSGYTCVSGNYSSKHGLVTLATAVIEGLNVFDVITADRVVAQVSTELAMFGQEPQVTFLGTRFENLKVCGYPVELELDLRICGDKPEGDRRYLEDRVFLNRISHRIEGILAKTQSEPYLPDWVIKQYEADIGRLAYLRQRAEGSERGERYSQRVRCSLIKRVGEIAIPGVRSFGNSIIIPDFGTVFLGEVEVGESSSGGTQSLTYFDLIMVRMELGSIAEGAVGVARVSLDGGGTATYGGEAESVRNAILPTREESFQEYASPAATEEVSPSDAECAALDDPPPYFHSDFPPDKGSPAVPPSPAIGGSNFRPSNQRPTSLCCLPSSSSLLRSNRHFLGSFRPPSMWFREITLMSRFRSALHHRPKRRRGLPLFPFVGTHR